MYTGDAQTVRRKIREAELGVAAGGASMRKDQILGRYLNTVYFGDRRLRSRGGRADLLRARRRLELSRLSQSAHARRPDPAAPVTTTRSTTRDDRPPQRRAHVDADSSRSERGTTSRETQRRAMHADLGLKAPGRHGGHTPRHTSSTT